MRWDLIDIWWPKQQTLKPADKYHFFRKRERIDISSSLDKFEKLANNFENVAKYLKSDDIFMSDFWKNDSLTFSVRTKMKPCRGGRGFIIRTVCMNMCPLPVQQSIIFLFVC